MSLYYFALVKRDNPRTITRIEVQDLGFSLEGNELASQLEEGLIPLIARKIKAHLERLTDQGQLLEEPKSFGQYSHLKLGLHDFVLPVAVDFELKQGFFTRLFPFLAKTSFVISEAFSTVISIAALDVMTAKQATPAGRALNLISSLTFGVSGLIMYFYSRGGYTMSKLGMKLDKLLLGQTNELVASRRSALPRREQTCCTSTKVILADLGLASLLLTNTVVSNISGYQSLNALGQRAREVDSVVPELLFDLAKWSLVTLGSVTTLSFIGSFFDQCSEDLARYITAEKTPSLVSEMAALNVEGEEDSDLESQRSLLRGSSPR